LSSVHPILNLEAEHVARTARGNDSNREPPAPTTRPKDDNTTSEEDRLLHDFRAGDAQAFGLLIHRYQDRLYTALARFLDRTEDALDVLQDTFLSAFANARSFKGNSRFYTWIYRIAMNHAIDHHRRRKPRQSLSIFSEDQIDLADQRSQTQPTDHLEREETRHTIQLGLQQLSPEHRMILVMKEIDDLRYEEIAEILDVPVGTVRSRLHRARADLKGILERMSK